METDFHFPRKEDQTYDLCLKLVSENGNLIQFVRSDLQTIEMGITAVSNAGIGTFIHIRKKIRLHVAQYFLNNPSVSPETKNQIIDLVYNQEINDPDEISKISHICQEMKF
jgi:hypothetical protein